MDGPTDVTGTKVTWVKLRAQVVKPSLKVIILAGGLMSTSICIFSWMAGLQMGQF